MIAADLLKAQHLPYLDCSLLSAPIGQREDYQVCVGACGTQIGCREPYRLALFTVLLKLLKHIRRDQRLSMFSVNCINFRLHAAVRISANGRHSNCRVCGS